MKEECRKVSQETRGEDLNAKGPSIQYVRRTFRKINISSPLTRTRTHAYQGLRNICVRTKLMIPSGSTNYDDRGGNNDNNSDNDSTARTVANERSQLFRPYTSDHASRRRRSNARPVYVTFYIFGVFEVLFLIKHLFVTIGLFW